MEQAFNAFMQSLGRCEPPPTQSEIYKLIVRSRRLLNAFENFTVEESWLLQGAMHQFTIAHTEFLGKDWSIFRDEAVTEALVLLAKIIRHDQCPLIPNSDDCAMMSDKDRSRLIRIDGIWNATRKKAIAVLFGTWLPALCLNRESEQETWRCDAISAILRVLANRNGVEMLRTYKDSINSFLDGCVKELPGEQGGEYLEDLGVALVNYRRFDLIIEKHVLEAVPHLVRVLIGTSNIKSESQFAEIAKQLDVSRLEASLNEAYKPRVHIGRKEAAAPLGALAVILTSWQERQTH